MKNLILIIRWVLGVILCLACIGGFAKGDTLQAVIILMLGLVLLPPVTRFFTKKKVTNEGPVLAKPSSNTNAAVVAKEQPSNTVVPVAATEQPSNAAAPIIAEQYSTAVTPVVVKESAKTVAPATIEKSSKPSKGIFAWFKGWGSAINTALRIDGLIKSFPDIDAKKLNTFLATRSSWGEGDPVVLRNRVIDGYDKKINADNVEALGQQYINFYLCLFPGAPVQQLENKIKIHKVEAFAFTKIKDDEALDPSEINEIIAFSRETGVEDYDSIEKIKASYDYYIMNWELDNGLFKGIAADLILQKNELCLYTLPTCELLEKKSVTTRVGYSGFSTRIKITKGMSYRLGSYAVSSQKEMVDISKGKGLLNVTTKRIIFKNSNGVTTINSNAITDIEPYNDAVIIFKATGKPITIQTPEAVTLYKYIRSAIRK